MLIHLHSLATTTPKVRAAIQASDEVGTVLAERFEVTPQTIYKWRKRGKPLSEQGKASNQTKSAVRARGEHVFGA